MPVRCSMAVDNQHRPSDGAADEVGSNICLGRGGSKSCFAYRDVKLGTGWQLFCAGSYTKTKGGEGYCPTEIIIIIIIKASQGDSAVCSS